MGAKMKVYAYLRVSTDQQAESGAGLGAQLSAITLYANQRGMTIENVFSDDGVSGATETADRPALKVAIESLKNGDVLLVAKRDRLARDIDIIRDIEKEIKRRKAKLISTAGEGTDTNDARSSLIQKTFADLQSQIERMDISDRTRRAMKVKKEKGERVGYIPFGYRLAGDGKLLEESPEEQSILNQIRELMRDGLSTRKIATEMNRRGAFNRGKAKWNHASIHRVMMKLAA
jgi:DNA invertase Pin-like site-specific DNA recombinase